MSGAEVRSEQETFPDERDFHAAWVTACTDLQGCLVADEVALALAGGALADRLAWVFVSGYQAAVRRCFPELVAPAGWTCLAAAESRGGPGCRLTTEGNDLRLNGEKSWIAGAAVLDSLVVSVGEGDQRAFAGVLADAPGVTMDLPREPGFLAEMSQGVARFDNAAVTQVVEEPARGLWFRGAEPLYVMLALNACLRSRAERSERVELVTLADKAIAEGSKLPAVLGEKTAILAGLAELRKLTSAVLGVAEEMIAEFPTLAASWQADARLFAMFGLSSEATAA